MSSTLRKATYTAFVLGLLAAPAFAAGPPGVSDGAQGNSPGVAAPSPSDKTQNFDNRASDPKMDNSTAQLPADDPVNRDITSSSKDDQPMNNPPSMIAPSGMQPGTRGSQQE